MTQESYAALLKEELENRLSDNPKYSLRAFARDLHLQASQLSRVLNGKQHLSSQLAKLVAQRAFRNSKRRQYFEALVEWQTARKPESKEMAYSSLKKLQQSTRPEAQLSFDRLALFEDWRHLLALELISVESISTERQMASQIGVGESQAKLILERLSRLGFIEQTKGRWALKSTKPLWSPTDIPNIHLRRLHSQLLDQAKDALEKQSVEQRQVLAKTFHTSRESLDKIRQLSLQFFDQISAILAEDNKPELVYQLNLQLFDLWSCAKRRTSK
jgi:uncharacterized protein (TIGR02147 family)